MADRQEREMKAVIRPLAAWTTAKSQEGGLIALILRDDQGREFHVSMPPDVAMAMGSELVASSVELTGAQRPN